MGGSWTDFERLRAALVQNSAVHGTRGFRCGNPFHAERRRRLLRHRRYRVRAMKQRLGCVALGDLQKVAASVLEHCSRHWPHHNWRLSELDAQLCQPVMLLVYIINSK